MTEAFVREQLGYYGMPAAELEGATQAYMERVDDGNPPDLAEWAEAYMAVL